MVHWKPAPVPGRDPIARPAPVHRPCSHHPGSGTHAGRGSQTHPQSAAFPAQARRPTASRNRSGSRTAQGDLPRGLPPPAASRRRGIGTSDPGSPSAGQRRMRIGHRPRRGNGGCLRRAPGCRNHHQLSRLVCAVRGSRPRRDWRRPGPLRGRQSDQGLRRCRTGDTGIRPKPRRRGPNSQESTAGRRRLHVGLRFAPFGCPTRPLRPATSRRRTPHRRAEGPLHQAPRLPLPLPSKRHEVRPRPSVHNAAGTRRMNPELDPPAT